MLAMMQASTNTAKPIEPETIGVAEAEVMSGISRWTWRRYAYTGKVDSVKVGTRLLIPVSEVRRVISAGYRPATDGPGGRRRGR